MPGAGVVRSSHSDSRRLFKASASSTRLLGVDLRFKVLFRGVECFALGSLLVRREFAQFLAELGQFAFAAQGFDAHGFDGFERGGGV